MRIKTICIRFRDANVLSVYELDGNRQVQGRMCSDYTGEKCNRDGSPCCYRNALTYKSEPEQKPIAIREQTVVRNTNLLG